ncbi:glucokinase [Parafrankia sp. BMG5.11]|uniref:glucokinase n=1 Tax=Parafrankia sp. BMG5.11 TaxID=222540 RepID=UPI0010396842|nr:glucokinase [Parafrankia sp. BMG5.11]TCJ37075.1 glucokinase [Parafrankia sp. BMG5.11]
MPDVVAVDIGGTHARFAIAEVDENRVVSLGDEIVLSTSEHASFQTAWTAFAEHFGQPLPRSAAIAIAGPMREDVIRFTNNSWTIRPSSLACELGLNSYLLLNDFEAVAHAVAGADSHHFMHVCGPHGTLPASGTICVVGPGTGLGVAQLHRSGPDYRVIPTEGGHIGFAPTDGFFDAMISDMRSNYGRVSAERVVSGAGLRRIYRALAGKNDKAVDGLEDVELWSLAMSGHDERATAALERFCEAFGAVAGDLALAHGAVAVVIAGGLGFRLKDHLPSSLFSRQFENKGRFADVMRSISVKLIVHPQPGLFGAAAAFAARG